MKGMYKMTEHEYAYKRALKDKEDYKYYEKEILYYARLIPLAGLTYAVIWLVGAVL